MNIFDTNDDMSETEKNIFVRRWGRWRRRGMWFFLLCMLILTPIALCLVYMFDPLFRSDPFAAESWAEFTKIFDPAFFMMAFSSSLILGVLFWFIGEELYRNFGDMAMADYDKIRVIESWESHHKRGMLRFVLFETLSFFVLANVATVLLDLLSHTLPEALSVNLTPRKMGVKVVFGVLLGVLIWYLMERKYRKAKGM